MGQLPASRVLVDFDCEAPGIPQDKKRCDYLYVDENKGLVRVAPIEIKSGAFDARETVRQLQGGTDLADQWLPLKSSFDFVPVLVHGKGIHKHQYKLLQRTTIKLRNHARKPFLIRCREPLAKALNNT